MDEKLKTYLEYLEKKEQDSNYYPTVEENTAKYNIENDPMYADIANQILSTESYQEALAIVNQYVKEDEFKQEQLTVDNAINNEDAQSFDRILKEEMEINNISQNIEDVKSNIIMYYNDPSKIETIQDENVRDFYYKMNEEYKKIKDNELGNKNVNKMTMVYTNPELNNNGYANLIFISVLIAVLAFIIFLSL